MFAAAALSILPLALGDIATPVPLAARQAYSDWCPPTLGAGIFDIAYNFTLAAWNTTLPNSNTTGVPLVVGFGGAIVGAEFHVLSTYASYPYNDYPTLSLEHGALHPNSEAGNVIADTQVFNGDQLGFIQESDAPAGAQIYCGQANTAMGGSPGFPSLAVNGDSDSFSLCSAGSYPTAQTYVIYKPQNASLGYDYDSCYSVRLHMVGLD